MASPTPSTSRVGSAIDNTPLFRQLVNQSLDGGEAEVAERRRQWEKRRDDALGPILSKGFLSRGHARKIKKDDDAHSSGDSRGGTDGGLTPREQDCLRLRRADEEWLGEAVKVHRAMVSLLDFLRAIRRPYLVNSAKGSSAAARRVPAAAAGSLDAWRQVTALTDEERDEIEFQVRLTIKRCLARIRELEEGEAVRKRTTPSLSANPFSRLLGSVNSPKYPGRSHPLYAEQLSQHRSAITQYLGNELAHCNARLGDMQEARLKAQRMKQINLAGSAAISSSRAMDSAGDSIQGKRAPIPGSIQAKGSSKTRNADSKTRAETRLLLDEKHAFQNDTSAAELTPQQIEMFDRESSALVQSLSDDLRAIEAAERKLSEISELQTQLIQHLGSQAEVVDNLHQEALGHTLEVGKGNEQLLRAKENNRQANRFLCIFLIGSGLGILFLHWMD